ncbi:hypothetical protein LSAT2_027653 [Lamellibrachia satsuma]|nr:hypothetical protein LSAT2_027653 [Lamellibrachia satsuma]
MSDSGSDHEDLSDNSDFLGFSEFEIHDVGPFSKLDEDTVSVSSPSSTSIDTDGSLDSSEFSVWNPGPRQLPPRNASPIEYFLLLFSLETIRSILQSTRRYGEHFLVNMTDWIARHPRSRFRRWNMDEIDMSAMKKYLGLSINMGLIRKKNVKDYWSTKYPSQSTPFFRSVMLYNKFMLLSRLLHVGELDAPVHGQPNFDPWNKVCPVLNAVNATFKRHFVPPQYLSIDESMVGMKNRVVYLQYMPNKRHSRFGIKKFELCDATIGYVPHIELYAGKDFPLHSEHGQAHAVVMMLLEKVNLLNKGHHLFTDNFYTKPMLAKILDTKATLLTGTVRGNSKGLPELPSKLGVGESQFFRQGNLLAVAFREKKLQAKPVLMLSTGEPAGMRQVRTAAGRIKRKPHCVADYNKYMGGVDISDRKVYHVSAERPSSQYWKKIFFNFLDIALLNGFELYKQNTDAATCLSRHDFLTTIVESLCVADAPQTPLPFLDHTLEHLPGKQERDCILCSDRARGIRKRSSYCQHAVIGPRADISGWQAAVLGKRLPITARFPAADAALALTGDAVRNNEVTTNGTTMSMT